jgi:drug/metabolite transporter (DMT)-like permease
MIYIILSILLFSFNNILWKKNLENVPVTFLVAYRAFFTSIVALFLFFYLYDFNLYTPYLLLRITTGSIFGAAGLFCMLQVIKKASLQWLGIYNLSGIVFTSLYLIFIEEINFSQSIFGVALVVLGFVYFIHFNKETLIKITWKQHFLLTLMTISFSISALVHWKNLTANIPPVLIISNQELVVFIIAFVITFLNRKSFKIKEEFKSYFFRVLLMAIIIFFALFLSFIGLKNTNPFISSVLFLASPLTTILLSSIIFKEKINFKNRVSILIIALGAFILHYFSV